MLFRVLLTFTLLLPLPAIAQPAVPPAVVENAVADNVDAKPLAAIKPAFELANDLDDLFVQLKRTVDVEKADRISKKIWELWQTSDSRTVDLLTHWARTASAKRRYGAALDLLDQVVVLRPDYAEGWNQRATLHFIMRNYDKSIIDIERTLALEPRHYGALAGLAGILHRLGHKEEALEAWYRALNIYPTMKNAQRAVLRLEEDLAGESI